MRRIILIAAMGLLALQAAAREPWQNGFSVGVEGNFALFDNQKFGRNDYNDFKGATISGSYTAFLWKGFFVQPRLSVYYEHHEIDMLDGITIDPDTDHATEVGIGLAAFGGYRVPAGTICSIDFFTGPYNGISINQHQTVSGHHRFDLFNKSSLRWRFGLGVNVWRLTVGASFDLGLLKFDKESRWYDDRESNVVSVGIGYNF